MLVSAAQRPHASNWSQVSHEGPEDRFDLVILTGKLDSKTLADL
jgi:hypothetical protein